MGIIEILTLLFIGLKLAEVGQVADWSWWAVFAPMWIGYPLLFVGWMIFFSRN